MKDFFGFDGMDEAQIRTERAKAREMRKSRWWQQKTASGKCYYCGQAVPFKELTMDHLVPLTRGGRSTRDNLVPSCKICNNEKKNMLPLEWEEYMEMLNLQKSS
ncbi:MAG: HNH endonuclease [Desulfobacteraceae bacterium]|nr:HNH endonuclease [Desulfobacteraceae bacterium]